MIYLNDRMYVYTHVFNMYMHINVCMHVCMHVCTYIHKKDIDYVVTQIHRHRYTYIYKGLDMSPSVCLKPHIFKGTARYTYPYTDICAHICVYNLYKQTYSIYIYTCVCIQKCIRICIFTYIHIRLHVYVYVYEHLHTSMNVGMCVYVCICTQLSKVRYLGMLIQRFADNQ